MHGFNLAVGPSTAAKLAKLSVHNNYCDHDNFEQHTCENYLDAFYNRVGCDSATLSHTHITANQIDVKSANLQGTCSQ